MLSCSRTPVFVDVFMHQRIREHRYSAIGKHLSRIHAGIDTPSLSSYFSILKNCQTKFDCLLYEMFSIKNLRLHSTLRGTPFEESFSLDCVSRVNSITSCFILIK